MEKAGNIVNILKTFMTVRKHDIPYHKTHKIRSKDVLSNTKLTIKFSPEITLFYYADNSNSICGKMQRFIS